MGTRAKEETGGAERARLLADLPLDRLRFIYERMALIRAFEERVKSLMESGVPFGVAHFYVGEEAVATGVCAALRPDDWIASTHRGHGHCIAKGVDVRPMMAELYGKANGTNRGKGGSMHITDAGRGMLGVNPIVGGGVPHAVGAALTAKRLGTGQVAVAFFGDGGANIGATHESLNLAAVWRVPCVFVCENNGYAQSTPTEYSTAGEVWRRAAGYDIPGEVVDGQDALAVYAAAAAAVERARGGGGPSLIEARTYRYYGHSYGDDPRRYRLEEEERGARARDCLARFRAEVTDAGRMTAADLAEIDAWAGAQIDEAVAFAEAGTMPDPGEVATEVYAPSPGEQQ
jgi:TPP-dependent pyruvate/acetoin dehydrogenase alpha subunit